MKKSKLITSLCMLILTIACLTFGVYSAVKTSFTASGTITFNNYGIDADITIDIYGIENGTTIQSTDENYGTVTGLKKRTVLASTGSTAAARSAYQANVITTTPTLTLGELKFDELNTTVIDEWRSKIVLVISFTNYSKFDAQLSITQQSAAITNLTATYGSKAKAIKSDGTTGVKSTTKLTITLTPTNTSTAVSGTFNPQITLQPIQMPVKGDLITMDLVEGTETVTGIADTYRVLNIDGNVAEVVAMYDLNSDSQKYWTTNTTTTDAGENTVTKYNGSDLDTYLNTTWYNTLSANAKAAIVENNITQYSYYYDSEYYETTHASYADYSSKAVVYQDAAQTVMLSRFIYALDVEDIEAYFGGTKGQNGKTAGTFSNADIWKLFWDTTTLPITATLPWLRSAGTVYPDFAWYVDGRDGIVFSDSVNLNRAARAAFKIDLSQVAWA